jgi:branched-chain amino acid transport system permease protein
VDIIVQLIINSIIAGAIYMLVALGFNLIYGATRFFNLAHGVFTAVGGYCVFFLSRMLGFPDAVGIVAGIIGAGFLGFLLDKTVFAPLRERKATGLVLLVASLGAFTAMQAVIAMLFSSQFHTLAAHIDGPNTVSILGGVITQTQIIILISGFAIFGGLVLMLYHTHFGKAIRAISDDEEVARVVGIHTKKIISYTFFIGSAIAGLVGVLVGYDTGIEPMMGLHLLLKGVIAAIVGGVGNVYGSVLGAFLLGFAENFGVWYIAGEWKDAIAFAILIIFLLFRPQGILGPIHNLNGKK